MRRRLATIMIADAVASCPAMERDEEGAVSRIADCLAEVRATTERFGGRVFATAGDALLSEFPSAVEALKAALEARSRMAAIAGARREDMRFGLHLADVLDVGGDLRGHGVNVAARIQAAAAPGEIDVSGAVYEQVQRASPCSFEPLGPRRFKGIEDEIAVYRAGGRMERHRFLHEPTRTGAEAPKPPLRRNALAVCDFRVATSADGDQSFLAEGLTEDLIFELSRLRTLLVVPQTASKAVSGLDVGEIGRRLGVGYVLAGSVRKAGDRVRLNLTLSETESGGVIWTERIQRPFDELLDVMDEVALRVASTVAGRVEHRAIETARRKRPENMTAYELYLRGLAHHRIAGLNAEHALEAVAWFRRAQEADPTYGRPLAMEVCSLSYLPDLDREAAGRQVARAIALDPEDPEAHRIMGVIEIKVRGDYEASRRHHERAMQLAPNDAYIRGRCAAFYIFAGELARAHALLDEAEAMDPFLPVWVVEERIAAYYCGDRFDEMLAAAEALPFQTRRTLLYQAAARSARGETDAARAAIERARAHDPDIAADFLTSQDLYRDRAVTERLVARLAAAGLARDRQRPAAE